LHRVVWVGPLRLVDRLAERGNEAAGGAEVVGGVPHHPGLGWVEVPEGGL